MLSAGMLQSDKAWRNDWKKETAFVRRNNNEAVRIVDKAGC